MSYHPALVRYWQRKRRNIRRQNFNKYIGAIHLAHLQFCILFGFHSKLDFSVFLPSLWMFRAILHKTHFFKDKYKYFILLQKGLTLYIMLKRVSYIHSIHFWHSEWWIKFNFKLWKSNIFNWKKTSWKFAVTCAYAYLDDMSLLNLTLKSTTLYIRSVNDIIQTIVISTFLNE